MNFDRSTTFIRRDGIRLCNWCDTARIDYARLVSDPQVMTFISDGKPRAFERAVREVDGFNHEFHERGWSRWAVHRERTGEFVGSAGFAEKEYGINFGQRFFPKLWRSRIPMAAAQLALEYGFLVLGFDRVYTLTNVNHAVAIGINRNYLGVDDDYGVVCDTPFGPHLRIDIPRAMFMARLDHNRRRIFPRAAYARAEATAAHGGDAALARESLR